MSSQFDNDDNENEIDDSQESETNYQISVYASDKDIFNQIQEIKRIKDTKSILSLQIKLSQLSNLKGLNNFINLTKLDLSNNQISSVKGTLFKLSKLTYLNLSCNKLSTLDGIEDLENLKELNVSHNKIQSLEAFSRFISKKNLNILNIKGNLIYDLKQFDYLIGFSNLKTLVLSEGNDTNPVCQNSNCNEYIEGILNIDENIFTNNNNNFNYPPQTQIPMRNNMSLGPLSNNNNISVSEINRKHFMNNTLNAPFTNMGMYREEIKNLHYNIQDIFRDQKKLIFKYEQDKSKWEQKNQELQDEIERIISENKNLKLKLDSCESNLKEFKFKNTDLQRENNDMKQNIHDKQLEISDLTIKLAQSKKDYELTLIDKNKISQLQKDNSSEINDLKNEIRSLKSNYDKMENTYKDLLQKKTDELSERMRAISSLETKIYDYSKQVNDKQKEIESLMENNSSLQQNIIRLNKSKGDMEFDLSKKYEKELNEASLKYKNAIEEIEKKYSYALNNKTEECLNDIKALEKHYETLISETSEKINEKEKENDKLKYSLDECKLLLKNSLEKEETYENEISNLKVVNKLNVDECSKAREQNLILKMLLICIQCLVVVHL